MKHRPREPVAEPRKPNSLGVDFGWRTHSAITDWTARADSKAAIVLSLGGALIGFFVTLSGSGRVLAGLHGWRHVVEDTGVGVTALGVLCAAFAVAPSLRRRQAKKIWADNYIYFGHLRRWKPEDLKLRLAGLTTDEELDVLSKQLITTSKVSWNKHVRLQSAIGLIATGVICVAVAGGWPR